MLEVARRYLKEGLAVMPLNGKVPVIKEWQNRPMPTDNDLVNWFSAGKQNIGIRTGIISHLIVIDIDGESGKEVFEETDFGR